MASGPRQSHWEHRPRWYSKHVEVAGRVSLLLGREVADVPAMLSIGSARRRYEPVAQDSACRTPRPSDRSDDGRHVKLPSSMRQRESYDGKISGFEKYFLETRLNAYSIDSFSSSLLPDVDAAMEAACMRTACWPHAPISRSRR
jgi:hypothetical protein